MRRIISILILLANLALLPAASTTAGLFTDDTLVSIDGNSYSVDDFKRWWKFWKDDDSSLPQTPDKYIDFLLLSREGKRMGLDETPGFQRQTKIFMQTRGLLMLKYEEVNSRIKVTDADIMTRYEEQFQPRWLVQHITFKDGEAALAAWQEVAAGKLTVDELLSRSSDQGGPTSTGMSWLRPRGIDQKWSAIFKEMSVGEIADPNDHDNGSELYYLRDQLAYDEEDFTKLREEIKSELWKEQEDALTLALIEKLRDKYEVKVDEERLAALDLNGAADTFTDASIITSNRQNVSEKDFMFVINRLSGTRTGIAHSLTDAEAVAVLKTDTAKNIIAQSVTNWEALDRHYEEKEPFKWEYEFNYKYRLMVALEQRLIAPDAEISEDEIKKYYQENIGLYTQPSIVRLYIIDETEAPIDELWADVATGKDFIKALKENELYVKVREAPASHLDPEIKAVVDKLVEGETSQIFMAQGIRVVVHLIKRTPEEPVAFEMVQESINKELWKAKIEQLSKIYLDELKSRSEIKIKMRQWEKIQKELGGV